MCRPCPDEAATPQTTPNARPVVPRGVWRSNTIESGRCDLDYRHTGHSWCMMVSTVNWTAHSKKGHFNAKGRQGRCALVGFCAMARRPVQGMGQVRGSHDDKLRAGKGTILS